MNRLLASGLLAVLIPAVHIPLAAEDPSFAAESRLAGKAIVITREGRPESVGVNVRFATIGESSFMIASNLPSDAKKRDQWIPLDKINGIKVFDTVGEALSYAKVVPAKSPQLEVKESNAAGLQNAPRVHIDGDRIFFSGEDTTLVALDLDSLGNALSELPPKLRTRLVTITMGPRANDQLKQQVIRVVKESGHGVMQTSALVPQINTSVIGTRLKPADEKGEPSVAGTVTYRGQPVTGHIFFHMSDGKFFGSKISDDGKYSFPNPPTGEFTVRVEGTNVPDHHSNQNANLKASINSGSNTLDFELN